MRKLWETWKLARELRAKAGAGYVLVPVPAWMSAELRAELWTASMEHAAIKWAQRGAEIPIAQWRAAMRQKNREQ